MFVSFEGLDGTGKSTQAELLAAALRAEGRDVVLAREPGGTELGERIRELLLNGPEMSAWTEAALFAAARAELVDRVISPALDRGGDVVCDRYLDSSLAYQGIARGLGVDSVLELNLPAIRGILPDRTFVLLLDPDEAALRGGSLADRMERQSSEFRAKVGAAYRELAERFPSRLALVDGREPPEQIANSIRGQLRDLS